MTTFCIQRGATPLCTWDVETRAATIRDRAAQHDGKLVIGETDKVAFVVAPAAAGYEYRIFIGDVPLSEMVTTVDDAGGVVLNGQLFWRELAYFESARGFTNIVVERQSEGPATEAWVPVLSVSVYVLPSKLGEDRYERMAGDLQELSRNLLVDLYGKSRQTYDLRFAKEGRAFRSREQELESISSVLDRLGQLLAVIGQRPASRIKTSAIREKYWGRGRLSPTAITWLARQGKDYLTAERPLSVLTTKHIESFDIGEHRVMRAVLELLVRRSMFCAGIARDHIKAIASERHLRHVRLGSGPTIYESVDLPKMRRLESAMRKAEQCAALAYAMTKLSFLRRVKPELLAIRGGTFQRSPEYRAIFNVIRSFLLANAIWYEGEDVEAITKLTSRLFEQWCYLRIVEAFRAHGLELREWNDAIRQNLRSRFILDFDRGLMFEGNLATDLRLRFRYEPWILGEKSALQVGETLCRGSSTDVAWCPDVVIECLRLRQGVWHPEYGIVLDCKYTSRIRSQHWYETSKYLEIRSSSTRRQVVKQLWLVSPGATGGIRSEDPAIRFDSAGPSCAVDEAVRFSMTATPEVGDHSGPPASDPFNQFASGTITFLRREFGSSSRLGSQ